MLVATHPQVGCGRRSTDSVKTTVQMNLETQAAKNTFVTRSVFNAKVPISSVARKHTVKQLRSVK